jgi:hypothetical protein
MKAWSPSWRSSRSGYSRINCRLETARN